MNQPTIQYETIERVVYRNGQFMLDVPDFVGRKLQGALYGELLLNITIRRPSRGFIDESDKILREEGYPLYDRNGRSLSASLCLRKVSKDYGVILEYLIEKIDQSRSYKDTNKRTTILLRIKTCNEK